ncbi:hypothetical protein ACFV4N_02485 [Actinosynnema sp. NPDC059797]
MHPLGVLFLLVLLCGVGPPAMGAILVVVACVAFFFALVEYVTAAVAGFAPRGPVAHLGIEPPPESEDGPDPAFHSHYAGPVLLANGRNDLAAQCGR